MRAAERILRPDAGLLARREGPQGIERLLQRRRVALRVGQFGARPGEPPVRRHQRLGALERALRRREVALLERGVSALEQAARLLLALTRVDVGVMARARATSPRAQATRLASSWAPGYA